MARLGHRGGIRVLLLGAAIVAFVIPPASVEAAGTCATPGRDGTATLNSVINTYYPGALTAAAGATTITLGTATGAGTPIAVGDLVVVIQMQDAAIDSANTGAYGNGIAGDPASGWTGLNSAGLYEYAVATSAVPLVGGALTISSGLLNTYTSALPTPLQGQRNFQVIRVPQYVTATLAGGLAAGAFNGSTGGVLVFDVDGALNLNGAAVSVSQEGFRAGLGRQLAGGAGGTGTDYVNLSANNFHAQKGEGVAGTPQYVFDSRTGGTVNNLVDGYPNGSTARGAPATAGGGGTDPHPSANDQNTGGGGGANGGAGGMGGNSWNTNQAVGGFGGTAFPATAARLTAGAGGGAGTRNNAGAANASSGGNGGAIVMIRTGSVIGTGTITTDMAKVRQRKQNMVEGEIALHLHLYQTTGGELIMGTGRFVAPKTLEVRLNDGGTRVLAADQVFLDIGTRAGRHLNGKIALKKAAHVTVVQATTDDAHDLMVVL